MLLERCNRCCHDVATLSTSEGDIVVTCSNCSFSEPLEVWQLFGWRSIDKYPPTFGGVVFVWGKSIGRKEARWDASTKQCSEKDATHWLRTSDPTKQINMLN